VRDLEIDEFWSFVGAKKRRRRNVVILVNVRRADAV
jgi:hypothetical protein